MSERIERTMPKASRRGGRNVDAESRLTWIVGTAAGATGLVAGLLYGFAVAVMPGLSHVDDRTFIDAMQRINVSIENPLFFVTFLGAPALTLAALVVARRNQNREPLPWLVAAVALTAIEWGVTGVVNIPLNNTLRDAGAPGAIADLARVRSDFEGTWVFWNGVRAAAATAACGTLLRALVLHLRYGGRARRAAPDQPQ